MTTKNILKGIGAVLSGFLVSFVLSTITDFIMVSAGVFTPGPIFDTGIILLLLTYRTVYNAIGFYVTGKLAPQNPNKHMLILLGLGMVVGSLGTYMAQGLGPLWYGMGIVALSIPAYFTAKYFIVK